MIQNTFNFEPFDIDSKVRATLSQMLKPWSRAHVSQEISTLTRREYSESSLNNWTAPSQHGNRCIPFCVVPALSQVTRSTALWDLGTKPIASLLSKTRLEEIAHQDEIIRHAMARKAELEGRV